MQAMALVRQQRSVLDRCQLFDSGPGMQQVLAVVRQRLPRAIFPQGTALEMLVHGAALDVMGELYATERPRDERLARFIQAYVFEGRSVVDITTAVLGLCDRTHVSRTYRVDACERIAWRLLTLVDHEDPLEVSAGLGEALERQVRRWGCAAQRASVALQRPHAPPPASVGIHEVGGAPRFQPDHGASPNTFLR